MDTIDKLKIEALQAALDEKSDAASQTIVTTVEKDVAQIDGKNFKFVVPAFMHLGHHYVSANAIKDIPLMTELVNGECGFLKQV